MKLNKFAQRNFLILAVTSSFLVIPNYVSNAGDQVIRIAQENFAATQFKVFKDAAAIYEKANPGWKVDLVQQDGALYESIGETNLLKGNNSPDAYFDWIGAGSNLRFQQGFGSDIAPYLAKSKLTTYLSSSVLSRGQLNGKQQILPFSSDVSNVIWYDTDEFKKYNLTPPKTWADLIAICAKFKAAGKTCFSIGNKDKWVAGNFFAHLYSRTIGDDLYGNILSLKSPITDPKLATALGYITDLVKKGYVNSDVNAINDQEAETKFFNNGGELLPMGSWLIGIAQDQAPKKHIDFFNLPAIPGGLGDQSSVLGTTTGYIFNAKSKHLDQVTKFFEALYSPQITKELISAGYSPLTKDATISSQTALEQKLVVMFNKATHIVPPPDTGYGQKEADALNSATAEMLGLVKTPNAALTEAAAALKTK